MVAPHAGSVPHTCPTSGVATISRTYGSGKNKKTVSATAVVMWDGGETAPYAFFLAEGKVVGVSW